MSLKTTASFAFILAAAPICFSQSPATNPTPVPSAKASEQLAKALDKATSSKTVPPEMRQQAYAKLLEGQRYIWTLDRLRSRAGRQNNAKLASDAIRESLALDPNLSEGYTALAELALNGQPRDADEAIRLALLATRVNPNNFGARRILGRLYAYQSKFLTGPFDPTAGEKSITEWKQVARLDPRNAEAWAFLSELYDRTGKTDESIDSLKRWLSASTPVDSQFYQMLTGGQQLGPENAALKLGAALLKTGKTREAIQTIATLVVDEPGNSAAVELLRDALDNADAADAAIAVEALRQAVYANPSNAALVTLLAQIQARGGQVDQAANLLRETAEHLQASDRTAAAGFLVTLGDLYSQVDRPNDAIAAYESSFTTFGLMPTDTAAEGDEHEFAVDVYEKMIRTLKSAGRFTEAKTVIDRSRNMLGKSDLFADRQAIALFRETGNRAEALTTVQSVRKRNPEDEGFIRLEATLLTETGRVDEAVALIKKLIDKPATPPVVTNPQTTRESIAIAVPQSDAFSNYLFISNLYAKANRGKQAVDAANQAFTVASGAERKQIARLTLASAQEVSGDPKGAESTLRDLLKETPGNPIALNNLGYFLLERNERYDEALELIQQAVKVDPTNPSYLDSLGWAYFKLGKLIEAEKSLKDALRFDSSSGTINEHLGDVYHKQGKSDLSKASWTRAVSLFSDADDVGRVKKKLSAK